MKIFLYMILAVFAIAVFYRLLIMLVLPSASVTSWFRSADKNRAVGGVKNSKHLFGFAFDVVPVSDYNYRQLQKYFTKVITESDHIHAEII